MALPTRWDMPPRSVTKIVGLNCRPAGPEYQSGGSLYRSSNARAHFVSTWSAMACGRYRSNISGESIMRLK